MILWRKYHILISNEESLTTNGECCRTSALRQLQGKQFVSGHLPELKILFPFLNGINSFIHKMLRRSDGTTMLFNKLLKMFANDQSRLMVRCFFLFFLFK